MTLPNSGIQLSYCLSTRIRSDTELLDTVLLAFAIVHTMIWMKFWTLQCIVIQTSTLHRNCRITISPFNFGTDRVQKFSCDERKYPNSNNNTIRIQIFRVRIPLWCKYSWLAPVTREPFPNILGVNSAHETPWCRVVVETSSARRTLLWCLLQVLYQ